MRVLYLVFIDIKSRFGLFSAVTQRIKHACKYLDHCEAYILSYRDTKALRFFKRLFLKIEKEADLPEAFDYEGIHYTFVYLENTFFKAFLRKLFNLDFVDRYARKLEVLTDVASFDLIHDHWAYPNGHAAGLLARPHGVPYVITAHGSDVHTHPLKSRVQKSRLVRSLDNAARNIFISDFLRKAARELGYSADNGVIIGNGIDIEKFETSSNDGLKRELGLENKKVIGFVGTLTEIKRADKFPEIFDLISKSCPEPVAFVVVGDGILMPFLRDCLQKGTMPRDVILAGAVDHCRIPGYIRCFDVLILPSRSEGFGLVVLEANACCVPVVGSSNGAIPEVIGTGGVVVEEGENFEMRFAEAVVGMMSQPVDRDALRARAENYSWHSIIRQELHVYREITAGGRYGRDASRSDGAGVYRAPHRGSDSG